MPPTITRHISSRTNFVVSVSRKRLAFCRTYFIFLCGRDHMRGTSTSFCGGQLPELCETVQSRGTSAPRGSAGVGSTLSRPSHVSCLPSLFFCLLFISPAARCLSSLSHSPCFPGDASEFFCRPGVINLLGSVTRLDTQGTGEIFLQARQCYACTLL